MRIVSLALAMCVVGVLATDQVFAADFDTPEIKHWTESSTNSKGEEVVVHFMTIDGIMVHETDPAKQPQPRIVSPGPSANKSKPGRAPADAIVLFDGSDLSNWTSTKEGEATKWVVEKGAMSPTRNSGMILTKQEFGSCQLHVEWATPKAVSGNGQGRGNSGLFLMNMYEIQILDSYDNETYPDGQAGALYGRKPPLVNASRKPGEWQSFDVVFHRPVFRNGDVVKRATFTVFHNGVLIQDAYELSGGTGWLGGSAVTEYEAHGDKGPIALQDHGNPVLFRNIWIRELAD